MHEDFTPIGITNYRNANQKFGIKSSDKQRHLYFLGSSGSGKTTLLHNMALDDITKGEGVAVLDPHAELAANIISHIPNHRKQDLIYFNPVDTKSDVFFNPLHDVPKQLHHIVTSGLIASFKKIWADSWGVRMEYILRYSILTLLNYPLATLLDIHTLLTKREFRVHVLNYLTDEHICAFWEQEFDTYTPKFRAEVIAPILNKMGVLRASEPLRRVLGHQTNTLNIKTIMDTRKILICNLSKGELGEETTAILGGMLITAMQNTALARANQPRTERIPFNLYADEIHVYINSVICNMLAECFKFKLTLHIAHQYIEQLEEPIRNAIFGNVGSIIVFRVGATDAEYLAKEFYPVFKEQDFVNLPRYHIYLKLMIDGTTSQPFSATTLPPVA
ncbi:MAG: type IV secretion system DNA-binding domain-containing protein [Flavipsychrobacter sp.]